MWKNLAPAGNLLGSLKPNQTGEVPIMGVPREWPW